MDQLSLCHIHNDILDDSLAEDNSHLGDIHHLEPKQKSKARTSKPSELAKQKTGQKKTTKAISTTFGLAKQRKGQKEKTKQLVSYERHLLE